MTNQTTLTAQELAALREKIVEANPEIKKTFRFCECGGRWMMTQGEGRCEFFNAHQPDRKGQEAKPEHYDRDIHLADVLLALFKSGAYETRGIPLVLDSGMFYLKEDGKDMKYAGCDWNLRQDSLDLQSPETLRFLFNLLLPPSES